MRLIKHFVFLMLLVGSFSFNILSAQDTSSYFLHTVERGQNLYSISVMYGVTQSEIVRLNPGSNDKIYAGQTLKIPQAVVSTNQEGIFHTIQSGETLYKLSVQYNVTVKEICEENPGLSAVNFKAGEVIKIPMVAVQATTDATSNNQQSTIMAEVKPRCREMHKVKRKETIFSVSQKYNITKDELIASNPELKKGMKKGQLLCIPYKSEGITITPSEKVKVVSPTTNRDIFLKNQETPEKFSTIKAAIVLPFLSQSSKQSEALRMVEFYEGFLLAVDSLKQKGLSMDLYVYDSGDEKSSLVPLLQKEEMKQMNIIFGPLYSAHIAPLASFAEEHNIRLVVPFQRDDEVFQNPKLFLVNTPQSYLYSEVYALFMKQFSNANVIFIDMKGDDSDKTAFIQSFKQELTQKGVSHHTINGADLSQAVLNSVIQKHKHNVFIPTSGNAIALNKITTPLKTLYNNLPEVQMSLFGYPEWQRYTGENLQDFFALDTYFYSSFYTSNLFPASKHFTQQYRKWFGKDMINSYPKYGMLGFDVGMYFLSGLKEHGSLFEQNIDRMNVSPIQTGFRFERVNNWGGFVNKKVFFIHFTKDFELIKHDFE